MQRSSSRASIQSASPRVKKLHCKNVSSERTTGMETLRCCDGEMFWWENEKTSNVPISVRDCAGLYSAGWAMRGRSAFTVVWNAAEERETETMRPRYFSAMGPCERCHVCRFVYMRLTGNTAPCSSGLTRSTWTIACCAGHTVTWPPVGSLSEITDVRPAVCELTSVRCHRLT